MSRRTVFKSVLLFVVAAAAASSSLIADDFAAAAPAGASMSAMAPKPPAGIHYGASQQSIEACKDKADGAHVAFYGPRGNPQWGVCKRSNGVMSAHLDTHVRLIGNPRPAATPVLAASAN